MAESIALGLRLGTTDEHANFTGIEGEITINETEKRAVVHDGTTKGGFPMARLDETGYALTKSSDGTKLQLKNKAGTVLSETDAPSSGSGVHVGNEAPTDAATDVWIDIDEPSSGVVTKVNGVSPDASGNVTITVGSDYTLPTATSSTLGGVKIGSNISVSSGTISVSSSNVTSALGYTPVKTVNGTSPNTSGAVTIDVGVKKVNGVTPDSNGNVSITVGSDYTLPTATSSTLGGVTIGSNISVSNGKISLTSSNVTTALGFTPLSSTGTAARATADASGNTITSTYLTKTDASNTYLGKSAKAASATTADSATKATQDASGNTISSTYATKSELDGKANSATSLSGYGITDAYTKNQSNSNFIGWNRSAFDVDTLYDGGLFMVASGSNVPNGMTDKYGVCLSLPYRQLTGNKKTDFGAQIFLPNGDEANKPNSMFYRTSLGDTWNAWQEVATKNDVTPISAGTSDLTAGSSSLATGSIYLVYE